MLARDFVKVCFLLKMSKYYKLNFKSRTVCCFEDQRISRNGRTEKIQWVFFHDKPFLRQQGVTVGVTVVVSCTSQLECCSHFLTQSHNFFKLVSVLPQLICELLALKNDVCSWLKKRSMVGVSQKSGEKPTHRTAQSSLDCFQPASCVSTGSPVALPRHLADLPAPAGRDQPAGAAPRRTGSLRGGIQDVPPAEGPQGGNRVAHINVWLLSPRRCGRSTKSFASSFGGEAPNSTWASLRPSLFFLSISEQ